MTVTFVEALAFEGMKGSFGFSLEVDSHLLYLKEVLLPLLPRPFTCIYLDADFTWT
jgi:hypothetical protein